MGEGGRRIIGWSFVIAPRDSRMLVGGEGGREYDAEKEEEETDEFGFDARRANGEDRRVCDGVEARDKGEEERRA